MTSHQIQNGIHCPTCWKLHNSLGASCHDCFFELLQENKRLKKLAHDLQLEIEKAVLLSREIHELEEK